MLPFDGVRVLGNWDSVWEDGSAESLKHEYDKFMILENGVHVFNSSLDLFLLVFFEENHELWRLI